MLRWNTGAVAQLGERVNGIHEVRGSIPLSSTIPLSGDARERDRITDYPYPIDNG